MLEGVAADDVQHGEELEVRQFGQFCEHVKQQGGGERQLVFTRRAVEPVPCRDEKQRERFPCGGEPPACIGWSSHWRLARKVAILYCCGIDL
ncbi:hypothetical protein GCM10027321_38150 [Massilia terrae]